MAQILYAVSALAVVMIFSFGMQRAGLTAQQEMYITEARARMLGVARETVERISRMDMPFDEAIDPDRGASGKVYPYISSPVELTSDSSFGGATLISGGLDIDDFHGMSVADSADGLPVMLEFEVTYVDALTGAESAAATFAKRLTVHVSTTAVRYKGEPVMISYSRVFSYPTVIDFVRGIESRPPVEI